MPELVAFVLCEKAIVAEDQTISLITLFQGINISSDFQIPEGPAGNPMAIPLPWTAYSFWLSEAEDTDKVFEQKISVSMPDGITLPLNIGEFTMKGRAHTFLVPILAWPLVSVGTYEVKLEVREKKKGTRFKKAARSIVNVRRLQQETV